MVFDEILQVGVKFKTTLMNKVDILRLVILGVQELTYSYIYLLKLIHKISYEFLLFLLEEVQPVDDVTVSNLYYLVLELGWNLFKEFFRLVIILFNDVVLDVSLYSVV